MEMASSPRTVEEIFKDYSARRAGVVRALTYGMLLHFLSSLSLFYMCSWACGFVWVRVFLIIFDLCVLVILADVDEFYGLCDPGIA